jgi:hypothetical protein
MRHFERSEESRLKRSGGTLPKMLYFVQRDTTLARRSTCTTEKECSEMRRSASGIESIAIHSYEIGY